MSENKLDVSKLSFANLALLMNSSDYGKLISPGQAKTLCIGGGFKVTDGRSVHVMKFLGLLLELKHQRKAFLPDLSRVPQKHKTKKALPDRRKEPNLTWRESIRNPTKFDDAAMDIFLRHYAMTGRLAHSSLQAGVTEHAIEGAEKADKEFRQAKASAWAYYRDHISEVASDQFQGIPEPIMGGKNRKEIVGWKTVFPSNPLLAMELKRTNPEYNEKTEVDMNVNGGVLVIPGAVDPDEYIRKHVKQIDEGDNNIIDVDPNET